MATALPQITDQSLSRPSRQNPVRRRSPLGPVNNIWNLLPILIVAIAVMGSIAVGLLFPEYMSMAAMLPVVVIGGLVMIVRPELALIITVAYIPFESDQFNPIPLPGGLSISKVLGFLLLGVFFFNILLRRRRFRVLDDSQDMGVVMLAGAMLLSGVSSEFPAKTFNSVERMIRMFAFYMAVKNLANTPNIIRALMWTFVLATTYASGWGINEFYANRLVRDHDIRAGGVYMDANDYAALTVVAIVVTLHLLIITKRIALKAVLAFCLGVGFYGLILSGSRGGLLAVALVMAIFIWRHPKRNQMAIIAITAAIISFPLWPDSIKTRLLGADDVLSESVYTQTTEHSTERRASYIVFGTGVISEYPLLGAGYRTFSLLYPRSEFAQFDNPLNDTQRFRLAHNTYLELAVGIGFVGLGIYITLFLVSIRDLNRIIEKTERGSYLWGAASGFQLALISLMVSSFFLSIEHFKIMWVAIALSSALSFQFKQQLQHQQEQEAQHTATLPLSA